MCVGNSQLCVCCTVFAPLICGQKRKEIRGMQGFVYSEVTSGLPVLLFRVHWRDRAEDSLTETSCFMVIKCTVYIRSRQQVTKNAADTVVYKFIYIWVFISLAMTSFYFILTKCPNFTSFTLSHCISWIWTDNRARNAELQTISK